MLVIHSTSGQVLDDLKKRTLLTEVVAKYGTFENYNSRFQEFLYFTFHKINKLIEVICLLHIICNSLICLLILVTTLKT
jgi:hypothetical protein